MAEVKLAICRARGHELEAHVDVRGAAVLGDEPAVLVEQTDIEPTSTL
jgi:hypothetical protein